ncbi:MAG: lipopolysaccharide transport system permease protein [Acidobacteriota bacterium]|jgi:lipopolysaccharide transport system permease protein|nr:lipopolysaccharide transport system permease protein [Acidobacteriota bacterium]
MGMTTSNSADMLGSTAAGTTTRSAPPHSLPDEPLFIIQPSKSWTALDLRAIWTYRELLYFLTWRDVKVRYKQTILGIAWVGMQPILTTLVFTIFLGKVMRVPSEGIPYPLFIYAGMLPWTFFSGAITSSSNSLVGNAHLITKIYFPRVLIPISAIAARLLDFVISFLALIALMIYYGVGVTWGLLMLPALIALVTLLALGVGMATSALNVKYRDVGVMMPLLLQLWMFASPVIYPMSALPANWQRLYSLNPLVGVIEGFRASLLGRGFDWTSLVVSTAIAVVLLVFAAFSFRRMDTHFADIV